MVTLNGRTKNNYTEIANIPAEQLQRLNQKLLPVRGMSTYRGTAFSVPPMICEL
jgi:hypothetical protein